ncbi:MAG TPA: type VI secretion system tip protein TssI/VgrG [Acetobacteraceae bacterium]|jgi:type VI secretion system secreted protein VgrG|nr:type VI secretion system tip protein TssI/VgrG [Acetobacteraceae bacterium]
MSGNTLSPLLLLRSPLGDDTKPFQAGTLHAIGLIAHERLSAPFEIDLTSVSTERAIAPEELLFQPLAVTLRRRDGVDRFFHGIVRRMEAVGFAQRARYEYRLEVVPKLWFLSQTMDCRIFQQRTTQQILQVLFSEHQINPVDFRLFGPKPVREYTTQFNETDLQFAQRIMQESGYFYYFEHSADAHTLVVTDGNQAFRTMQRPLHRVIHRGDNVDIFQTWSEGSETAYGTVQLQDYDPTKPSTPVNGQQTTRLPVGGAALRQVYRWPAMTLDNSVASDRARFRMEASEAAAALREGSGTDPNLCPGFRFLLDRDPFSGAEGVDHAVHSARHTANDETWIGGTSPPSFDCQFTCFLQTTPWRDDLSVPRPSMAGIYSAIVLGSPGEEIHSDSLARIKVRPLFDHRKDTVASMAIFIRILHAWAGDRWGWQHLPRVGTEVGISFMNGDPDSPVVVGCFYHQENPPVFPVPAEQTKQGFRSRSTLHGGRQDYNELSFDDRKGQEVVLLHAQKDHTVEVEHDQDVTIGRNRSVTVTQDNTLTSRTGNISVTADVGAVTITATTRITLRVGASSITLTAGEINIATPVLTIQAGEFNVTAASFTVEAPEVTLLTPALFAPPPIPPVG